VLDSYIENEATRLRAGDKTRASRLKDYFGNTPISAITTSSFEKYIDARKAGKLGSGRSDGTAYATKNRLDQANRRGKRIGIPVVKAATTCTVDSGLLHH
jgi:hypothetical protein